MQTFKEIIQLAKQSSEVRFPVWTESECHQKKKNNRSSHKKNNS